MRYGLIPDAGEERFVASPRAPLAMFDSFVPLVQASALMAAVRHGVFEGMRHGQTTVEELADALKVDAGTLLLLLRVLSANGYVAEGGSGSYGLSEIGRATLLEDSPDRLTAWLRMMQDMWPRFLRMGDVLRSGEGIDFHAELTDPEQWGDYQAGMLESARRTAQFVASVVPVKVGAARLLDIGGSHGLYGALIARTHPPLQSEVLDLPSAVEQARELAVAEGLDDVVTHRGGDALTGDLGEGWDVVLLSNILHHFTATQIAALLGRVRAGMTSGGTVAIWDVLQPAPGEPPELLGDAFALYFRLTSSARCYTTAEFTGWLSDAGFDDLQVHPFPLGRSSAVITGRASDKRGSADVDGPETV